MLCCVFSKQLVLPGGKLSQRLSPDSGQWWRVRVGGRERGEAAAGGLPVSREASITAIDLVDRGDTILALPLAPPPAPSPRKRLKTAPLATSATLSEEQDGARLHMYSSSNSHNNSGRRRSRNLGPRCKCTCHEDSDGADACAGTIQTALCLPGFVDIHTHGLGGSDDVKDFWKHPGTQQKDEKIL